MRKCAPVDLSGSVYKYLDFFFDLLSKSNGKLLLKITCDLDLLSLNDIKI